MKHVLIALILEHSLALQTRPLSATGPDGECIWPYVPGIYSPKDQVYAGIENQVYEKSYGVPIGPQDSPAIENSKWGSRAICSGQAPTAQYSDEVIINVTAFLLDYEKTGATLPSFPLLPPSAFEQPHNPTHVRSSPQDTSIRGPRGHQGWLRARNKRISPVRETTPSFGDLKLGKNFYYVIQKWNTLLPTEQELVEDEQKYLGADYWTARLQSDASALPISQVEAYNFSQDGSPPIATWPENAARVHRVLGPDLYETVMLDHHPIYSYVNLLRAVATFPSFCRTLAANESIDVNSDDVCRLLLASLFSLDPLNYSNSSRSECTSTTFQQSEPPYSYIYPPVISENYCGRGPFPLRYTTDYGVFSKVLFKDADFLLDHPDVVSETWLAYASAIWSLVSARNGLPSPMTVIDTSWYHDGRASSGGERLVEAYALLYKDCNAESIEKIIATYQRLADPLGIAGWSSKQPSVDDCKPLETLFPTGIKTYWNPALGDEGYLVDPSINARQTPAYVHHCVLDQTPTPFEAIAPQSYQDCISWHYRSVLVNRGNAIFYRNGEQEH